MQMYTRLASTASRVESTNARVTMQGSVAFLLAKTTPEAHDGDEKGRAGNMII